MRAPAGAQPAEREAALGAQPLGRAGERCAARQAHRRRDEGEQLGAEADGHGAIVPRRSSRNSAGASQWCAVAAAPVPVHAGWTFAPVVVVALVAYVGIYAARWRTARAEGGSRAAGAGRLALW